MELELDAQGVRVQEDSRKLYDFVWFGVDFLTCALEVDDAE
eukprot:CAMPEP_0172716146 /NCGR_PEP_ID=MMETSP1074-20121228/67953_1 /TAXON_ID=2916 /ORGANISM="Ceratium fusus, Strain PA161109" /LENGTH=40 /DNA_ID= /DNA_START= /DNA_END= /DNA_ORIENTATION=